MEKNMCGRCHKCGSDNLEYGDTNLNGESMGYEFECRDCHAEGIEWYNLHYVETLNKD